MASLIVKLHDVVKDYIKSAKNVDIAGKIGAEVLLRTKEVVKKHMWEGEDACAFHVALLYPIVARELTRWNKIATRRMKSSTRSSQPWQICFSRDVPVEEYKVLKLTILTGKYGVVFKSTRNVEYLHLSSREALCLWIGHVISNENGETQKNQDLFKKLLKNGAYCEVIVNKEQPFVIKYSSSMETLKVFMFYGCWNAFGVPQHIF